MRTLCLGLLLLATACSPAPAPVTCDPACPASSTCIDGECVPNAPGDAAALDDAGPPRCNPPCSGALPACLGTRCVACTSDDHCAAGTRCTNNVCVPGCADDTRCKGLATATCCGGQCVDTKTDLAHCGACGMLCNGQHSSATCAGGQCRLGACNAGWGDCNNVPNDGCETNLHVDAANCGKCGAACASPHGVMACADTCYLAACSFGYDDCNGDASDGCEVSVLADPKNCGACGQACSAPAHATAQCINSACQITRCDLGWSDCDGNSKNGCETATGTDVANCGRCGNACGQGLVCVNSSCTCQQCNIPGAKTQCVNNQCVFAGCLPGFGDCDNNPANGCEVNFLSDAKNCNGCGMACPNGQNCFGGQCLAKFVFQLTQTIDGQTVTCSAASANGNYTECDDLKQNNMYFPNGINCGPVWSLQNCAYSDTVGFCQSLTGTAKAESYYTCSNSILRTVWKNHQWSTTTDNGYTQHVRCYY